MGRGAHGALVGKPQGKRPLWRPMHRWEDNTKMDLQEVGGGHGVDWLGSGQRQVAGSFECGNVLLSSIQCG